MEIESFALSAVKLEEILWFVVEHSANYRDTGVYSVVSFRVSVFYIGVIVVVLAVKLVVISDVDRDLEVYFDAQHLNAVAFENPVRYHVRANDCNLSDSVMLATFSVDAK